MPPPHRVKIHYTFFTPRVRRFLYDLILTIYQVQAKELKSKIESGKKQLILIRAPDDSNTGTSPAQQLFVEAAKQLGTAAAAEQLELVYMNLVDNDVPEKYSNEIGEQDF